jgi:hypothetical protein
MTPMGAHPRNRPERGLGGELAPLLEREEDEGEHGKLGRRRDEATKARPQPLGGHGDADHDGGRQRDLGEQQLERSQGASGTGWTAAAAACRSAGAAG